MIRPLFVGTYFPIYMFSFFCSTIVTMARKPSVSEAIEMCRLIRDIDECNDLLKGQEIRSLLKPEDKAELVRIQINKAKLMNKLKMLVRDFDDIPPEILKGIYPC
ncbi:GfV-C6-ORF2 [Ichnoviriform fumiferanae]|uniref:GfV-C6-ORF2 n=1 Tax=Ichnoviriform fumiferanae TaxID=419435 RepID=A2PZW9_9VIRU|nr:GfV-C6-ORF2 [Ichnoviriform fumiferanae]BAF45541.1 GfV-C6-ORF2 [Ichnoviriform fumiferanae]